jgi:hypothetical protein
MFEWFLSVSITLFLQEGFVLFNDIYHIRETIGNGSCGYQALGMALSISWVKVLQVLSGLLKQSSSEMSKERGQAMEDEVDFNNESLVDLDKNFWLTNDDITILALHYEIIVIAFSHCAGNVYMLWYVVFKMYCWYGGFIYNFSCNK